MKALVLVIGVVLSGCYEWERHVNQPNGTVKVERGKCAELRAPAGGSSASQLSCTDHYHYNAGQTASLVIGIVVAVVVVIPAIAFFANPNAPIPIGR